MKTLICNARLLTMDEGKVYSDGCIVAEDAYIRYAGAQRNFTESFDKVIDARGGIVMPGLVNAHTHSPMTLLRGCANDLALDEW